MRTSQITKQIWVAKVNGYVALNTIISFDLDKCEDSDEEDSFNISAKDVLGDVHLRGYWRSIYKEK